MKYGVCLGLDAGDRIKKAAALGYDYMEVGFSALSRSEDSEFEQFKSILESSGIKCEAANSFLPRDYKVTGKNVDEKKLSDYIERGMKRGAEVGLKTVVFGSGGARELEDGTDFITGFRQIADFMKRIACPIAAKYGVTIVLEPLCKDECNIINTVIDGASMAASSGCDNAGGLADIYHMHKENDAWDNIRRLKGNLLHAHISYPFMAEGKKRIYPRKADEYDYIGFIDALRDAGCSRCSIEAQVLDFDIDAAQAIKVLKSL